MRARSIPLGAMFGWIPASFRLVRGHFGAWFVASLITLLAVILMMAPMMYVMFKSMAGLGAPGVPMPTDLTGFWISYALCIVVGMVLMPPLLAGWFRMCAEGDRGGTVSGLQVFEVYADRGAWLRLVVFALLAMLAYALVFGLLFLAFHGIFSDLMAMQAAQQAALATGSPPPPPSPAFLAQIFALYAVMLPVMFLLQFIYMVGFAEVSMRPTSPVTAFGEAAGGVLKNLLKLILLMICVGMIAAFAMFLLALLFGLVIALLMVVSKVLAFVAVAVLELVLLAVIYPLMFAFHYFVWKDMLGGDDTGGGRAVAI
jgi:hypothetical protein